MPAVPRRRTVCAVLLVSALLLTACSGGDPVASTPSAAPPSAAPPPATALEPAAAPTATPVDAATADPADVAASELPQFASDFDRVCETGVGFGGAASYEPTAGTHPVLLFEEQTSGTLITASVTLPAGWAVEEDGDFDDNTELAATQLVACSTVVSRTPNGTSCDLEADDGTTTTLALADATYEVAVHGAVTGELLGTETIEATGTDCPFFVFVDEGQTEYLNSPSDDQYTQVLQPYVSP